MSLAEGDPTLPLESVETDLTVPIGFGLARDLQAYASRCLLPYSGTTVRQIANRIFAAEDDVRKLEQSQEDGKRLTSWEAGQVSSWRAMDLKPLSFNSRGDRQYEQRFAESLQRGWLLNFLEHTSGAGELLLAYGQDRLGENFSAKRARWAAAAQKRPEQLTPTGMTYRAFCLRALDESKHLGYAGKHYKGPYYQSFSDQLAKLTTELHAIEPSLPLSVLHAKDYQSGVETVLMAKLSDDKRARINALYKEKNGYMWAAIAPFGKLDSAATIEANLLSRPPFIKSDNSQACVSTAFRMAFAGVTGETINHDELTGGLRAAHGHNIVEDEVLLKMFQSPVYQAAYPKVETIEFTGMSLAAIAKVCRALKAKDLGYKIFCVLNVGTTKNSDTNVTHSIVLGGADKRQVYYLDPNERPPYKDGLTQDYKQAFLNRWAVARNSGYFVISA